MEKTRVADKVTKCLKRMRYRPLTPQGDKLLMINYCATEMISGKFRLLSSHQSCNFSWIINITYPDEKQGTIHGEFGGDSNFNLVQPKKKKKTMIIYSGKPKGNYIYIYGPPLTFIVEAIY